MPPYDSAARHRMLAATLAFMMTTVSNGCGGGKPKPDASAMATISGSVTNNGKPVTQNSSIVFSCSEKGATAAGTIDSLGKFSLKEADPSIGIPAGRYQVLIRPPEPPPVTTGSAEYEKMMKGGMPADITQVPKAEQLAPDIPSQFYTFATSGLEVEVKPGPNTFDFDLAKLAK